MTKTELLEAIKATGAEVKSNMTKAELQMIYDKLHVHSIPEKEPEVSSPEKEVSSPEKEVSSPEPSGEPIVSPEIEEPETAPEVPEKEPEPVTSEFDELLGKIRGAEAPTPKAKKERPLVEKTSRKKKKGESSPDSFRIEGYILLLVTDTVFPFVFAWLNNMFDKKIKIKPYDLQLSQKDFDKLEPLADQAADYMAVQLNPIAGFVLVSAFMYSNNLIMVRMSAEPAK
jgi:hypothetical protein